MLTTTELVGAGHALDVRQGDPQRDGVDGLSPNLVIAPHTAEGVAATLGWASRQKLSVLIEGGGTKRAWGRAPDRLDVILSLQKLDRILDHRHGDLTVTVEAGLKLKQLNETLGAQGQQLPLDPPYADGATIGGLLATNDSGPARQRFGTPRDLVIGVQLATTDGRLAKAGGQVVKNVAGYDLSKLISGSFGTLAAIVSATFKVAPRPGASKTLVIDGVDADRLVRFVAEISGSQLEPVAFEIRARQGVGGSPERGCLLRFASLPEVVDAQVKDAAARAAACGLSPREVGDDEQAWLWRTQSALAEGAARTAVVRVSWLPANLARVLALIEQVARGTAVDLIGRAAVGAGTIRIEGDTNQQAAAIGLLRQSDAVGNVVVTSASTELKSVCDVWGRSARNRMFESVKRVLDPNSTLGAGRSSW